MPSYRVGVIFGSRSTEHEVSVVSAMQAIQFLSKRHNVTPIYITKEGFWLTGEKLSRLATYRQFNPKDPELQPLIITGDRGLPILRNPLPQGIFGRPARVELDVIFPVFHGVNGEDGTLQGLLDLADIPYVGSGVLGSCIGIDKILTKAVLKENTLPVLDYLWFSSREWELDSASVTARIQGKFPFPVIVKPARLGSSIGIQKAESLETLRFAIDVAIHFDNRILIEPYLENKLEINCSVLGNDSPIASVCEQPISRDAFLTYDDKYLQSSHDRGMAGASRNIPAPISSDLTKTVQDLAIRAFLSIGALGICRVDFIIDRSTGTVYINELNTIPGSLSFYLWEPSGIAPEELVDRLLELAFEIHRKKRQITYSVPTPLLQQADLLGGKKRYLANRPPVSERVP